MILIIFILFKLSIDFKGRREKRPCLFSFAGVENAFGPQDVRQDRLCRLQRVALGIGVACRMNDIVQPLCCYRLRRILDNKMKSL